MFSFLEFFVFNVKIHEIVGSFIYRVLIDGKRPFQQLKLYLRLGNAIYSPEETNNGVYLRLEVLYLLILSLGVFGSRIRNSVLFGLCKLQLVEEAEVGTIKFFEILFASEVHSRLKDADESVIAKVVEHGLNVF
jgi:hypothetical protein